MSEDGLLSRLLGRDAEEEDSRIYSAEEVGTRRSRRRIGEHKEVQQPRGLNVGPIAEMIAELPSTVPREHAILIVQKILATADIKLSELDASTQEQESQLSFEIERAKNRQSEVREKTARTVHFLEAEIRRAREEIRRAQEACESAVGYEEEMISRASAALKGIRRVRAFFDLPETERKENPARIDQGTQILNKPFGVDRTPLLEGRSRRPGDPDNKTH